MEDGEVQSARVLTLWEGGSSFLEITESTRIPISPLSGIVKCDVRDGEETTAIQLPPFYLLQEEHKNVFRSRW